MKKLFIAILLLSTFLIFGQPPFANARMFGGGVFDPASPGTIGGTTPGEGNFTNLIIVPSATEAIAIDLQGDTNDYTGAAAGFGMKIARDVNRGTNAIPNYAGWQSYLNVKHTDATISGDRFAYGNITRIDQSGNITNTDAADRQYWNVGTHNTSKVTGDFDTDSTGVLNAAFIGSYNWVWAEGYDILDTSTGSPANTFAAYGIQAYVQHLPNLNGTADATFISAGVYVSEVEANTEGTSTAYGMYIGTVSGADTNYGIYDASGADSVLSGNLLFTDAAGPAILNEAAHSNNPTLVPNRSDPDSGIGQYTANMLSLIVGGIEGLRIISANGITYNLIGSTQQDVVLDATTNGTTTITKAGENFLTTCAVGDVVIIRAGSTVADYGIYYIAEVTNNTTLVLNEATTGSDTDVGFMVFRYGTIAGQKDLHISGMIANIPETFTFTTECDIDDPLLSSTYLLVGDDDGDNDTIDLQDGEVIGQSVRFIANNNIDANDTVTIGMGDTTCINCPALIFDKEGDTVTLRWLTVNGVPSWTVEDGTVLLSSGIGRNFTTQAYTSSGNITEAQILASRYLTNQGAGAEIDLVLPDLEYYVNVIFIVNEAFIIEINPPNADAHEAFDLDGTVLNASDCIDMSVGIGDKISATRMQWDDGTWKWSFDTIRGIHIDTGASD